MLRSHISCEHDSEGGLHLSVQRYLFGYLLGELVGRNVLGLIHPEDRFRCRRALLAVLARPPSPRQVELRVRRKDGDCCEIESKISNLLDPAARSTIDDDRSDVGFMRKRQPNT